MDNYTSDFTISTFSATSSNLIVSDPSYHEGIGKQCNISNSVPGDWMVFSYYTTYTYGDDEEPYEELTGLMAQSVNCQEDCLELISPPLECSIDSGMVCIFDKPHFQDSAQYMYDVDRWGTEKIPGMDMFTLACYRSTEGGSVGVLHNGCVALADDGMARVSCYRDKQTKQIVRVSVNW